ncbi:uncharacterized protein BDZ99DRAFT_464645 [Mytilinidion resinicola]|uniref:Uncharacterized protein n=1 Tax=Mytilinidion resinicola TaxID=574789 RepID=A0A6A6YGS4_9PEZI|nr:uncharacterized protein BDZ99DRAFT_464645 [Mytilinidion resinicola]KAF2807733.1 hypothetical protein BDZ99DRAFT_464645 [Mytilinidion resinicola]
MAPYPKLLTYTTRRLAFTRFKKPVSCLHNSPFRSFSATGINKGGAVAWALRLSNGQEYCMTRWTNVFPLITTNDAFLAEEPEAVQESLKDWLNMKEDWEHNQETGDYEFAMTGFYEPFDNKLCPNEYGFIFTDFMTKHIIACTSYCSFSEEALKKFDVSEAVAEIEGLNAEIAKLDTDNDRDRRWLHMRWNGANSRLEEYQRIKSFFDTGRLHTFRDREFKNVVVNPLDFASYDEFVGEVTRRVDEAVEQAEDKYSRLVYVDVEPPPGWQVEEFYHSNIEERKNAVARIKELGLVLSEDEERYFGPFLKGTDGFDDEDDGHDKDGEYDAK